MTTVDLRKDLKNLFTPSAKEVELVRVPKFNFLMIDGKGKPDSSKLFQDCVQALYSASYNLKFKLKFEKKINYPVMPLEGLWWMSDNTSFDFARSEDWCWTLMILQPQIVTMPLLRKTIKALKEKKDLPHIDFIRLGSFEEGISVQTMHIGPYASEGPSLQKMSDFARARGLEFVDKHHEIYMSDPRRVKPERIKTILRHPVRKFSDHAR